FRVQAGVNLNGIAARGGWMVTVQSGTGFLFRLNPKTGDTTRIDTGGYLVSNGDGLDFRGRTLYAVRNVDNTVAVLRVSESLKGSKLKGEIQRDPPAVDYWITRLPLTPDS